MLEVIVVVAVLGLLAALVAVGMGRGAGVRAERNAMLAIHGRLLAQRVRAMERSTPHEVRVIAEGDVLKIVAPLPETDDGTADEPRVEEVARAGLVMWAEGEFVPGGAAALTARFDSMGRSSEKSWFFASDEDSGGRMWALTFDPISGAAALERRD